MSKRKTWQWWAAGWLGFIGVVALVAPWLPLPFEPAAPDLMHMSTPPLRGAADGHWLGTDPLGRDVLANLIFGARTVLALTLPAAVLAAALGAALGSVAGFWGNTLRVPVPGWLLAGALLWWALALPGPGVAVAVGGLALGWLALSQRRKWPLPTWPLPIDGLVLAASAGLGTVPRLLLVVAVAAGGRLSPAGLLLLLTLTSWASPARLVRAETLRIRQLPFVEAGRASGLPAGRLWLRHVLPAALRPLRVELPLSLASLLVLESTISFLGIGLPPDVASWGRLISAARLDSASWWTAAFPVATLMLTIAALRVLAQSPAAAE